MKNTLDLEKLTIEEVQTLLANGESVQELLVSVVKMSTTSYSSVTGKFKPSTELIDKQSKLVQFCITKGAKFRDAFKNPYEIPASFIENNLPLIIASKYNSNEILQKIVTCTTFLNDPLRFITKLIDDHNADTKKLYFIDSDNHKIIEFLLNKGMKADVVLKAAFSVKDNIEKQKELFDLVLKPGVDISVFKNLNIPLENCNESTFKLLMDNGVSAQNLLEIVIKEYGKYNAATGQFELNQEMIAKQTALTHFLIGSGAKLQDISDFPSDFVKNHPELVKDAKEARYFSLADFVPNDIEMDSVVLNLMKGVFIKQYYSKEYTEKTFLEFCYALHKVMDKSPTIAKVLSYVSQMPNLEIYIDDEALSHDNDGIYRGHTGKIYIQPSNNNRVSTIVHECLHKALDTLYKNTSRPYSPDDTQTKEQISKLIESDLLVQELVPEYNSWFNMKYSNYTKEKYDKELFTHLVTELTEKILGGEQHKSKIGTREFTEGAWEILQKIVATMPVAGGTIHKSEDTPESLMFSEKENDVIQKSFISNKVDSLHTINPNLDSSSIDFLLSKGMQVEVLLRTAFYSKNKEKQKELFDLAFKHGTANVSFKDLYIAVENCNEGIFKLLMDDYKVSAQDLLNLLVLADTSKYNPDTQKSEPSQELIAKQTALTNFLIGNGAKLKDAPNFSSDFVKNNLQLIIENKVNAKLLNLSKLTIEEAQTLLTYNSPKDLLVSVTRMSTTEYSRDTEKFEIIPELIAKQSELIQLCLTKGAKLRDAFKTASEIPASFIENNLPLIIASKYNPTKLLEYIAIYPHGLNDQLSLITKLIRDHKADAQKLSSASSDLSSKSIDFLLNKGMKGDALLGLAFGNNDKDKQKELFELAFKHGANSSTFKDLDISVENCNEDIFKLLMEDYKVSPQDLLNLAVGAKTTQYNQEGSEPSLELIAKQTALANLLIGEGAKLKDVTKISSDFVKNNLQLIIENKVNAKVLDLQKLTIEEVKALLTYNSPQDVLDSVTQIFTTKYSKDTRKYELSSELIAEQDKLIQLCTANLQDTFKNMDELQVRNSIFKQGVETYAVNLLWISSKQNTEQQYLHPSKTSEELATKFLMPAIKWAKSNPTADINIWYDSSLYALQAISNTQEMLTSVASKEGCTNIKLQDIRKISVVQDNADLFADGMPIYFRIDLLKMILCLHSLTKESKDAAIFSDLEVGDLRQDAQRMSKAELFDEESMRKLEKVGVLVNLNQGGGVAENQYLQVIKDEHIISSLKHSINICLSAATMIWNKVENSSSYACEIEKMHVIPFTLIVEGLSSYFVGSKYGTIKVRADLVKEGQNNEWITYNPSKHSELMLKEISNYLVDKIISNNSPASTLEDILKISDPMGFLCMSNMVRTVDVRDGNSHDDNYNIEKIGSAVCYKALEADTKLKEENQESKVKHIEHELVSLDSTFPYNPADDDVPTIGADSCI